MHLHKTRLILCLSAATLSAGAQAALVTQTSTEFLSPLSPHAYGWMRAHDQVGYDAQPNLMEQSGSFDVIDNNGSATVTSYSTRAGAASDYLRLSARAHVSVDNPMTLGTANAPYADPEGNLIPGGVPVGYASQAMASVYDAVRVTSIGGADVASLRFELAYDGTLSGRDNANWYNNIQEASLQISQYTSSFQTLAYHGYNGSFDRATSQWSYDTQLIEGSAWSVATPVVNGQASFYFFLTARANVAFYNYYIDGGSYEVSSDFSSTLHIVRAHAYDAAGNEVMLQSVLGASGTHYAIAAVPEPSTWLLCIGGLLVGAMKLRAGRRQASN